MEPALINKNPLHFITDSDMDIIEELHRLHRTKPISNAQLLNYYKEVPISGAATSIRFDEDKIFCRTNETQSRAISLCKDTFVSFTGLPHDIHAKAHFCTESMEVTLSDLTLVKVAAIKRSSIRVRMHIPHSVIVEAGPHKLNGRLFDISLAGCAINISDHTPLGTFTHMQIQLTVPLKTGAPPVTVRVAAILSKTFQENKLYTCIFMFDHNKSSEDQIGKIVAMRQMEIIRELK